MKKISLFICAALLCAGMCFGATAGKGVFSVAANKTVQFANTVSVYNTNDLIQWAHLSDVTDAGWEVLTGAEWSYLLASGRAYAYDLNALGTVDGKNGLIILPDSWVVPTGCSLTAGYAPSNVWSRNSYTFTQWAEMEAAGAVFLPAGGYRWGSLVSNVGTIGNYWSTTPYDTYYANCVVFCGSALNATNGNIRSRGFSVRPVREKD